MPYINYMIIESQWKEEDLPVFEGLVFYEKLETKKKKEKAFQEPSRWNAAYLLGMFTGPVCLGDMLLFIIWDLFCIFYLAARFQSRGFDV